MFSDTGILIKQISDLLAKRANASLKDSDLTLQQSAVLIHLFKGPTEGIPLKEIEEVMNVAQPTALGIVQRLEQKNLVTSYDSTEDKRRKIIRITEDGKNKCPPALEGIKESENIINSKLTDEELTQLQFLLAKVRDALKDKN